MNHLRRSMSMLGLLLGLFSSAGAVWTVGSTPTDFTCTDWNGQSWNLYAQHGKVVLLSFGATW